MWTLLEGPTKQLLLESEEHPHTGWRGNDYYNHVTCSFATKEELFKHLEILDKPCLECGRLVISHWAEPVATEIKKSNLCFGCHLWTKRITEVAKDNGKRIMIVESGMYSIGPEDPNNRMRGFAGSKFVFQTNDGRIIESTNVWHGGTIPELFKTRIPINAVILTGYAPTDCTPPNPNR